MLPAPVGTTMDTTLTCKEKYAQLQMELIGIPRGLARLLPRPGSVRPQHTFVTIRPVQKPSK